MFTPSLELVTSAFPSLIHPCTIFCVVSALHTSYTTTVHNEIRWFWTYTPMQLSSQSLFYWLCVDFRNFAKYRDCAPEVQISSRVLTSGSGVLNYRSGPLKWSRRRIEDRLTDRGASRVFGSKMGAKTIVSGMLQSTNKKSIH